MMDKIYMAGASIKDLETQYVTDALKNGWYEDKYYYVETLESKFAQYHNRKYALMTPNCTTAIWLLLAGLNLTSEDEILVPECTWIASVVSGYHLGCKLVFCDIDEKDWCISIESIKKNITKKTKAIIAVNLYGNMANWKELEKIANEYNIFLIEDAAESLGCTYFNTKSGKFGIGSVFSFHNTKTITTGEGGMLLIDDKNLYDRCIKLRDLGRGPETKAYYNELIGYKFMPFNLQAALGLAQFERLEELISIKKAIFKFYYENLSDLDIQFNYEDENIFNSAWMTTIILGKKYKLNKTQFIEKLSKYDIPCRPFFYPLSSLPAFNLNLHTQNPISYNLSERGINLPSAMNLSLEQLNYICLTIKQILK